MMCPCCNVPVVHESSLTSKQNPSEVVYPVDIQEEEGEGNDGECEKQQELENEEEEEEVISVTKTYEEMRRDYDEKNSQQRNISAKLGQKMLLGWTLLGIVSMLLLLISHYFLR